MVSEHFLPRPHGGGVGRHVNDLAEYLSKTGEEVHVLAPRLPCWESEHVLREGTRVIGKLHPVSNLSFFNRANGIYFSYDLLKNLKQIGNSYDIVHVHSNRMHLLHCLRLSKPIVTTIHAIFPVCIRENPSHNVCKPANGARCAICFINNEPNQALIAPAVAMHCSLHYKLVRKSFGGMRKIICVSDYLKEQMKEIYSLPEGLTVTIPNGVNAEAFNVPQQWEKERFKSKVASPDERIILFVGRFVYEKGIHVLTAAMPEITRSVNAKLILVGVGPMESLLRTQVQRAGLSNKVVFAGCVDDHTLKLLYKSADVCVVPSLFEPFGITAIEAFAAQTPLVVADSGGLSEIVEDNRTGVKVVPNSVKSLAEGVTKILLDQSFAEKIKSNAYAEVLEKYTWERVGQKLRQLYQNLCYKYADN